MYLIRELFSIVRLFFITQLFCNTIAFLRLTSVSQVAAAKETKMNLSNLAKILGPTIIGYSSMEALPEEIMKEVGSYL